MTAAAEARMRRSFALFNHELKRYAEKLLPAEHATFVKHVALDALRRIVMRTPVDTGRLRGNWQVGINSSPEGVVDRIDKSGSATIKAGQAVMAILKFGDAIFITNNLPYAIAIEGGHSTRKAPVGMVAVTMAELRSMFP